MAETVNFSARQVYELLRREVRHHGEVLTFCRKQPDWCQHFCGSSLELRVQYEPRWTMREATTFASLRKNYWLVELMLEAEKNHGLVGCPDLYFLMPR